MKRMIALLLAVTILFSFSACGSNGSDSPKVELSSSGRKGPSADMIQADIEKALYEENQYATLTNIETVKSLTNEGEYNITLAVTAETKYADWTYEVDMFYTKYDQGWQLDNVAWINENYEQVRLPNVDDMVEYAGDYLLAHEVYSDVWFTEYLLPMQSPAISFGLNTTVNDEVLEFCWEGTEHLKHAYVSHYFTSLWCYDSQIDNWTLYPDNSHGSLGYYLSNRPGTLTPNYDLDFSGEWHDSLRVRYTDIPFEITITNFSWDSFDAEITWDVYDYMEDAVVGNRTASGHFTRVVNTSSIPSEYTQYMDDGCIFSNGDDEYIVFSFSEHKTYIHYVAYGCELYVKVTIEDSLPKLQ